MKELKGNDGYKPRIFNLTVEGYDSELSPALRGLVRDFAQQMANEYKQRVSGCQALLKAHPNDEWLHKQWSPENIEGFASGKDRTFALDTLRKKPFKEITWGDMQDAMAQDEEATVSAIAAIHNGAADYIAAGLFAADAAGFKTPFERAQFSVIRNAFIEEWQPRGGIESGLVDMLAQSYVGWQFWLRRAFDIANHQDDVSEQVAKSKTMYEGGSWQTPRVTACEYLEQATQMADRFNRMFLRTLRQMRDLRRYNLPVKINNAAQVNIGNQQVNVKE